MENQDRERTLAYFERLGPERVRLYTRIDCERFFGGWQARELAEEWLAARESDANAGGFWRKLVGTR
jgi:hypothetical protein